MHGQSKPHGHAIYPGGAGAPIGLQIPLRAHGTGSAKAKASAPKITLLLAGFAACAQGGRTSLHARCLPAMLELTRSTMRRAAQVRLPQVAASLTLTTALSIAPLVAVSFALFKQFPIFRPLELAIEQHLLKSLLPADLSRAVLKYLHQFAANASSLTMVGALCVLAAAVMMLLTFEGALNQMWDVKKARPLPRRVGLYLLMLAVGPVLVGASLWTTASLLGASLGLMQHMPSSLAFALDLGPVALCSVGLAILFHLLPSAPVRWRHAIVGGLLGGIALELGKRAFAAYLIHGPTYRSLYGAFATLPVFLLWLYFSCLVTLSAALFTAHLGRTARSRGRQVRSGARAKLARARG
jgi:membrane protein